MRPSTEKYRDIDDGAKRYLDYLDRSEREQKRTGLLVTLLLAVALTALFIKVDAGRFFSEKVINPTTAVNVKQVYARTDAPLVATEQCDLSPPPNGRSYLFNSFATSLGNNKSKLTLSNEHSYPLIIQLNSPDQRIRYQAISIHPNSQLQTEIPPGTYGLVVMAGTEWCNIDKGFLDGKKITAKNLIEFPPGETKLLSIASRSSAPTDVYLTSTLVLPEPPKMAQPALQPAMYGNGAIGIQRQHNGSYYIDGSINSVPTKFQIDTGANITSVSRDLAYKAGMYSCSSRTFNTANGRTTGCVGTVRELTFGNYQIKNVEVAAMPNLQGSLLGMNVLKLMRIEQSDDILKLSYPGGSSKTSSQNSTNDYRNTKPKAEPSQYKETYARADDSEEEPEEDQKEKCFRAYAAVRDQINARMRQGHSSQQGEWYRERLRQNEKVYSECRDRE